MTSNLSQQLQRLSAESSVPKSTKLVSFLFDANQAATLDLDTVYSVGVEGLSELCKIDEQFTVFKDTLFSTSAKDIHRELQNEATHSKINQSLSEFLNLATPYFLLRPTHKAMEYLIRRYRIHEYNVDALFACILPYHDTNLFARMLQLIKLSGIWTFLQASAKNLVYVPASVLVERCIADKALLQFICEMPRIRGKPAQATVAFYTKIIAKVVESHSVDSNFIRTISPYITSALKSESQDYKASSYVLISQLASKGASVEVLNTFARSIVKTCTDGSCFNALACVVYLCQNRNIHLSYRSVLKLFSFREFIPNLSTLHKDMNYDITRFVKLLLGTLITNLEEEQSFQVFLHVLEGLPVGSCIPFVVERLFQSYEDNSETDQETLRKLLRSINSSYPNELDGAIAQLIQTSPKQKEILTFVNLTLEGTRHQLLEEFDTTLFLSLSHPQPRIRCLSIDKVEQLANKNEMNEFVEEALAQRLNDESEEVLFRVLEVKGLVDKINNQTLLERLPKILESPYSDRIKKRAMKLLSKIAARNPSNLETVLRALTPYILPTAKTSNLTAHAIQLQLPHPLVQNLSVTISTDINDQCVKVYNQIVSALASNVVSHFDDLIPFCKSSLWEPRTSVLFTLILNKVISLEIKDDRRVAVYQLLLDFVQSDTSNLQYIMRSKNKWEKYQECASGPAEGVPTSNTLRRLFIGNSKLAAVALQVFTLENVLLQLRKHWSNAQSQETLLERIYVFATSFKSIRSFESCLKIIFAILSENLSAFLSRFWIEGKHSPATQVHSLVLLDTFLSSRPSQSYDFQLLLPSLLVAFKNPLQVVRKVAIKCLETMESTLSNNPSVVWANEVDAKIQLLPSKAFHQLVKVLLHYRGEFLVDASFLKQLFTHIFQLDPPTLSTLVDKDSIAAIENYLFSYIAIAKDSLYGKYQLLEALSGSSSSGRLVLVYPYLKELVEAFQSSSFTDIQAKNLEEILKQFTIQSVSLLNTPANPYIQCLVTLLSVDKNGENTTKLNVAVSAMQRISPEFFAALSLENQKTLFSLMVNIALFTPSPSVRTKTVQALKELSIDADVLCNWQIFPDSLEPQAKRRRTSKVNPSTMDLDALKRIDFTLELIQTQEISNSEVLISHLFKLLTHLKESSEHYIEYTRQLILTTLTNLTHALPRNSLDKGHKLEKLYNLNSVADCLSASQNPQTHNAVLLLLAEVAELFPKKVIGHVMSILTFMGSSTLKQDDTYTFHVIQKTIQAVIPAVLHGTGIDKVLQVFVDAFPNIPAQRRMHLFTVLVQTISVREALHWLLQLFLSKHITDDKENIPEFCHRLCAEFSSDDIVGALVRLIQENQIPNFESALLKDKYKVVAVEFIADHISSTQFLDKLLGVSPAEHKTLQSLYLKLLESLLLLSQADRAEVPKEKKEKKAHKEVQKAMSKVIHHAIDTLNELLSVPGFIKGVSKLLQHEKPQIQHRALLLLNSKVESERDTLSASEITLFINMSNILVGLLESENDTTKQSALLSLEVMARSFAGQNAKAFAEIVPNIIKPLRTDNVQVLSSTLICLATFSAELKAFMLPHLPLFFPILLNALRTSVESTNQLLALSVLSSLEIIIAHIPQFMNPYLKDILSAVTHPNLLQSNNTKVHAKAQSVCGVLATSVSARLLLPAIYSAYKSVAKLENTSSLILLLDFLKQVCAGMDFQTTESQHKNLVQFFFTILDYRATQGEGVEEVESHIISAFLALVMKLNENLFKPVFLKLLDWAQLNGKEQSISKLTVLYHTIDELALSLKSLFIPYFGFVLDNAISQLSARLEDAVSHNQLLKYIFSSLHKCFLYDSEGFVNKERFDKLMQPLVDQLEIVDDKKIYKEKVNYLLPCLTQLAVCVNSDMLWKPLNYQILLKTRHDASRVRHAALRVIKEWYNHIGEEFLVLLPETVPFIAELLEDSSAKVKKICQELVQTIEQYLGDETISSYL